MVELNSNKFHDLSNFILEFLVENSHSSAFNNINLVSKGVLDILYTRSLFLIGKCRAPVTLAYRFVLPTRASVIAPHKSMIKSSVNPKASKSELSIASAKSIEFVLFPPKSQI